MFSSGRKRKFHDDAVSVLSNAPKEIPILDFAKSRAAEILALSRATESTGGAKRLFQTLPRHMRRRATSYNIKRLPRRLQDQAAKEYQDIKKTRSKRPSRRFRRRPQNLLAEYTRRQRKHIWLETHIWHAKRFKMADQWGYRIPIMPSEKSSRATYRASAKHCLLQDVSYTCCLELHGPEDILLDGLSQLTSTATGKTFAAKSSFDGSRQGQTIMYSFQTYPYHAIGPVSFLWNPTVHARLSMDMDGELVPQRDLWIWCHPTCYKKLWAELCKAFSIPNSDLDQLSSHCTSRSAIEVHKDYVRLTLLKDEFVRFRLWGPLCQGVLSDLFKKADISSSDATDDETWWNGFYGLDERKMVHDKQWAAWNGMKDAQSPAELPPHIVLALTVRDPRLFLPPKKKKVDNTETTLGNVIKVDQTQKGGDNPVCTSPSAELAVSALWFPQMRKMAGEKLTEQELNRLKSRLLIPGRVLELGEKESRIPVLLIQRPDQQGALHSKSQAAKFSRNTVGYASGWDIILPLRWGMAFWIGLVYRGARVGGAREAENVQRELGRLHYPSDFPDTEAGQEQEVIDQATFKEKHNRYPPAKRPNFSKLGVKTPFSFPWSQLVEEWQEKIQFYPVTDSNDGNDKENTGSHDFYVVREKAILKNFSDKVENPPGSEMDNPRQDIVSLHRHGLLAVKVTMAKRGSPEKFASICLPTEEDLEKLKKDKNYGGPVEPHHKDFMQEGRKKLKKLKKSNKNVPREKQVELYSETSKNVAEAASGSIVDGCSRPIIGFLKCGAFSFRQGQGAGLGFCSVIGISKIRSSICLIRPQDSFQYRFVQLEILTDIC